MEFVGEQEFNEISPPPLIIIIRQTIQQNVYIHVCFYLVDPLSVEHLGCDAIHPS